MNYKKVVFLFPIIYLIPISILTIITVSSCSMPPWITTTEFGVVKEVSCVSFYTKDKFKKLKINCRNKIVFDESGERIVKSEIPFFEGDNVVERCSHREGTPAKKHCSLTLVGD